MQNALLSLGALLLAVAGIVFAAVTYRHLGVVGRALVLLALTGLAAATPVWLVRRGLSASGEAVAAVATGALALAAAGHALAVPVRASRIGATLFAQLPALYVLDRVDASLPVVSVTLTALAAVDLLAAVDRRVAVELRRLTAVLAGLWLVLALLTAIAAVADDDRGGAAGLLALAAVAALAAARVTDRGIAALPPVRSSTGSTAPPFPRVCSSCWAPSSCRWDWRRATPPRSRCC